MLTQVQVEATFPDGTKLVSVSNPIITERNSKEIPGEYILKETDISLFPERNRIKRTFKNTGSRSIQVGSHFPVYKANAALRFERSGTENYKIDIPSGVSVRWELGQEKEIELVEIQKNLKLKS